MAKKPRLTGDEEQSQMAELIDDIREFDEFKQTVLPALRQDIDKGLSPEKMREKYRAIVQARLISIIATTENEAVAVNAAARFQDRDEGKPTEFHEHRHKLEELTEKELDSLLHSEFQVNQGRNAKSKPRKH